MAGKERESDTLRQQRKAREEFLKLKQIQSGEMQPPPPMSSDTVMPKTFGEKLKSYWYYYRWIVLTALLIAAVLAVSITQCATRTNYDYSVILLTRKYVSDSDAAKMAEYFEARSEDINGDGEIHIQLYNCSYDEYGNISVAQAKLQKFVSLLQSEDYAAMFILDEKSEEHLLDVFSKSKIFDNSANLSPAFYQYCDTDENFPLPENLKLLTHYYSKESLNKDERLNKAITIANKILAENGK